jgi:YggT family protein
MIPALLFIFNTVINLYIFVIIAAILLSWLVAFEIINVRHPIMRQIVQMLTALTEPVLRPVRRILPTLGGMDFSPFVVVVLLEALQIAVNRIFETGSLLGV